VKSKLKEMRLKRRLSQSQLAYLSNVNVRNIKTYEQNENDINKAQVNILLSLARVLNCSIEDILN
jgi:DNA-binding XRE family transcriptional regulator